MLENLAYQWEADSVASRTVAVLFAPFITNSELWGAMLKNTEIEVLHALTYSEIVRQCVKDPSEVFKRVMANEQVLGRLTVVKRVFEELERAGCMYKLGMIPNDQSTYNIVFKGLVALYSLERIQFMSSFASTFAIVEQGYCQGIGKLVQKIMQDEYGVHAETVRNAILVELRTVRGQTALNECRSEIKQIVDDVCNSEFAWNSYLFSNGRSIVGLNNTLLDEYTFDNAQPVYQTLGFEYSQPHNSLKYMNDWLDINKTQNAQQEADGNNYALNVVVDDLEDQILEF